MKGAALRRGEDMPAAAGTGTDSAGAEGYALRCAQEDRGGFRCPPQILLDLLFPSPDDQGLRPLDPGAV